MESTDDEDVGVVQVPVDADAVDRFWHRFVEPPVPVEEMAIVRRSSPAPTTRQHSSGIGRNRQGGRCLSFSPLAGVGQMRSNLRLRACQPTSALVMQRREGATV